MTDVARIEGIERHTIYPIPAGERHGRAVDLFTVWFGSNIMILTIVTGALATLRFRLSLIAAILAILIGNLVGGIFMALHAAQGPQLGVPQMVQTRGQFGSVGAIFVVRAGGRQCTSGSWPRIWCWAANRCTASPPASVIEPASC